MADFHPCLRSSINVCCRNWGIENVGLYSRAPEPATGAPILFSLVLHRLPLDEGMDILHGSLGKGKAVLVADYKLPERNLDYPAYWLGHLAESVGTHGACYRAFMHGGGIEGCIRRLKVIPQRRAVLWGGGIGFVWICDKEKR